MPRKVALRQAAAWLDRVGLTHRLHHLPSELSGGEQQRGRDRRAALIGEPPCSLADEPTGELDSANATRLIELLIEVNQELGQTMVIATHDSEVASSCRRLLEMKDEQAPSQPTRDSKSGKSGYPGKA